MSANRSNLEMTATEAPFMFCQQLIWYIFLGASGGTYVFGLLLILNYKLFRHLNQNELEQTGKQKTSESLMSRLYRSCESLAAGQTIMGKLLISTSFLLSVSSVIIYIYLTYTYKPGIHGCATWKSVPIMMVDFILNVFFLIHFFIRFFGARDKLIFWFSLQSCVDILTIPNISFHLYEAFVRNKPLPVSGFRFLRALRFIDLPDILVYLRILSSRSSIRITQLMCTMGAVWLAGAGMVHLLENAGDFWISGHSPRTNYMDYYTCLYFLLVTMSTVGYGDYSPQTYLGRAFVMIYIMGALGMFASFIPEIGEILADKRVYSGDYEIQYGRRHIVVCGHLTLRGIKAFLRDMLHPDRDEKEKNIRVIFLGQDEPDLKLAALIKRHETKVQYFQGNVTKNKDLDRVKIKAAEAVMILANTQASDAYEEDWTSIMRVIAIKDYVPTCKIIVQIIQYQNKAYLSNIPSWDQASSDSGETCGDQAVCMSELKLGLMAQGCLAPGFSTLLVNLLTLVKTDLSKIPKRTWQHSYACGASFEFYKVKFSSAFHGQTFVNAVDLCMNKLNILLVAVEIQLPNNDKRMLINPWDNLIISDDSMEGLVIAHNEVDAKRTEIYCVACHSDTVPFKAIKKCRCHHTRTAANTTFMFDSNVTPCHCMRPTCRKPTDSLRKKFPPQKDRLYLNSAYQNDYDINRCIDNSKVAEGNDSEDESVVHDIDISPRDTHTDSTGLFHWCPERTLEEAKLTYRLAVDKKFKKHVVVCLISHRKCCSLGLCSFTMPLRSSSIDKRNLKDIIIVGDPDYIAHEWTTLQNLPQIYILPGSPLNRAFLRAVNIRHCSSCVILASHATIPLDPCLIDKEPILCALNIKTMPRRGGGNYHGTKSEILGDNVPLLTELRHEPNVQFLDQDDDPVSDEMFLTQPFATGRMFNITVLDSLISTTFFNPTSLTFLQTLVTGGATPEVEQILAEGLGLLPGTDVDPNCRYRCSVCLLPVNKAPLGSESDDTELLSFNHLFNTALRSQGIICLGLSRLIDPTSSAKHARRFVYTFPHRRAKLLKTDLAYCLRPLKSSLRKDNGERKMTTRM